VAPGGAAHRVLAFSPLDGIPAADSTHVLMWYSPTALYIGIRAFEAHGAVHATLPIATRSRPTTTQVLLARSRPAPSLRIRGQPLRRQMDGTIVETGQLATGGWSPRFPAAPLRI
jgi:hypothetical protein